MVHSGWQFWRAKGAWEIGGHRAEAFGGKVERSNPRAWELHGNARKAELNERRKREEEAEAAAEAAVHVQFVPAAVPTISKHASYLEASGQKVEKKRIEAEGRPNEGDRTMEKRCRRSTWTSSSSTPGNA